MTFDDDSLDAFLGDLNLELPESPPPEFRFEMETEPIPEPVESVNVRPLSEDFTPVGDGTCVTCGAPTFRPPGLTKAGHKKRVPKYCDLHAPNVQVPTGGPGVKGMESQLQRVQQELADDIRLLATLAGPLLPVTGMVVFNQADPFTTAIIKLAKNNQGILRILHRAASVAPIYTVAETLAATAYAVQVDINDADPHNGIARRLRVEDAYNALYPDQNQPEMNGSFIPPPVYTPQ